MRTQKQLFLSFVILGLALILAACGGASAAPSATATPEPPQGDPEAGETLFTQTCSSCHGPDGTGIVGLGKDLTTSTFVAGASDTQLLAFMKTGRPASDPANTTGVDMPPKGGNPSLDDEKLLNIIAFIRSVQH